MGSRVARPAGKTGGRRRRGEEESSILSPPAAADSAAAGITRRWRLVSDLIVLQLALPGSSRPGVT